MSFKSFSVVALVASALLCCAVGQALAVTEINSDLFYETNGLQSQDGAGLYWDDTGAIVNMYGRYYTADYNPGTFPYADPGFRLNFGKYFIDHNTKNPVSSPPGGLGANVDLLQLRSADVQHSFIGYDDWGVMIEHPLYPGSGAPYTWGGTGITSNFARDDATGLRAVGLMPGWLYIALYSEDPTRTNEDDSLGYFPELRGISVPGLVDADHGFGPDAVIGMYTRLGDTDFDGAMTGADYGTYMFTALNPTLFPNPTWSDGDFDHDGAITGADYSAMMFSALAGSGPPGAMSVSGSAAVPEPATWLMLAAGTLVLLAYRLRRKKS